MVIRVLGGLGFQDLGFLRAKVGRSSPFFCLEGGGGGGGAYLGSLVSRIKLRVVVRGV